MGESSTCLIQPSFSTQLRDQLSESISFGRFMCDSTTWDNNNKWSNLSHKRYVEEAANYSKPGSVAQKKAFFEDYYKKKALLAKENAAAIAAAAAALASTSSQNEQPNLCPIGNVAVSVIEMQNECTGADPLAAEQSEKEVFAEHNVIEATEKNRTEPASLSDFGIGNQPETSNTEPEISTAATEISEGSESEKPLLKDRNADEEVTSSVKKPRPPRPAANLWPSSKITTTPCPPPKPVNRSRKENMTPTNNITSTMESVERIKTNPKPLFSYINRTPARDSNRVNSLIAPLRTPSLMLEHHQTKKSTVTPKSDNRRNMNRIESATPRAANRTTGPKWRYFGGLDFSMCMSATCRNKSRPSPTASSPFNFRTEERAVKRKEKLELKFDATTRKVQLQTKLKEKAECELKKLRQSLCFRARPLPSFYKERKTPKNDIVSEVPKPSKLQQTKRIPKDMSTLHPPPLPRTQGRYSPRKNKAANVSEAKKSDSKALSHRRSLAVMISSDNNSPK